MSPTGTIFDIERFAIHDGPGIRTTLFLKGCPLACWWCHNPESISGRPQLAFFAEKCIGCGRCFTVCPEGVHEKLPDGSRALHRERCTLCGTCVAECCSGALAMEGRTITVEEAVTELARDRPFYETSGGGVTLSGGEPLAQPEFTAAVLERCRSEGMHTCLDTSGQAPWEHLERALAWTDLVLYDFKIADPALHRKYTGVANDLIRENLLRVNDRGTPIEIRMPVIPGVNDGEENLDATAAVLAPLASIRRVTLLGYHRFGESKYRRMGRTYRLDGTQPPSRERMEEVAARLAAAGLATVVR
jgi:pyruvate formate lyase activating enzyme